MPTRRPPRLQLAASLLAALAAAPASAAPVTTRLTELRAVNFPEVRAHVHVTGAAARAEDLRQYLQVTEDGVPVEVLEVRADARPTYLALVLDRSGSMRPAMASLKAAAKGFLQRLDAHTRCQLWTFSSRVDPPTRFQHHPGLMTPAIDGLTAQGATALYDALAAAVRHLSALPRAARKAVLVFTDGRDAGAGTRKPQSKATAKQVVQLARRAQVPVFTLALGKEPDRNLLSKLASLTGGQAAFSAQPAELAALFDAAARSLSGVYSLRYTSPRPEVDGSIRKVQVVHEQAGTRGQGQGRYRVPKPGARRARRQRGLERYQRLVDRLRRARREGFRVDVDADHGAGARHGGRTLPLRIRTRLASAQGLEAAEVESDFGGRTLRTEVTSDGRQAYLAVLGPDGFPRARRVRLDAGGPVDPRLAHPTRALLRLGGAPTHVELYGEDLLVFYAADGVTELGRLRIDRETGLPRRVVRVDPDSGALIDTWYRNWVVGPAVRLALPAEPPSDEAPDPEALREFVLASLDAAAAARGAAAAGVEAGRAGAEAGVAAVAAAGGATAAATHGLAAARAGLFAAATAAQMEVHTRRLAALSGALAHSRVQRVIGERAPRDRRQRRQAGILARARDAARRGHRSFADDLAAWTSTTAAAGRALGEAGRAVGEAGALAGQAGALAGQAGALAGDAAARAGAAGALAGDAGVLVERAGARNEQAGALRERAGARRQRARALRDRARTRRRGRGRTALDDAADDLGDAADAYGDAVDGYADSMDAYGDSMDAYGDSMDSFGDAMDAFGDTMDAHGEAMDAFGDAMDAHDDSLDAAADAMDAAADALDSLGDW